MITSLYIVLFIIAVILFMKGMDDDAIAYMGISLILFLILMGQALSISVPFIDSTDAITEKTYVEYGVSAFCLVFIFIDLIFMVLNRLHKRKMIKGDIPYVPPGMQ